MDDELQEMGPIDYFLFEWKDQRPQGELAPLVLDLVERGVIRLLDVALLARDENGDVAALELGGLEGEHDLGEFEGATTGLLSDEDIAEAGATLDPGAVGLVLVFENSWAAPFATAVRRTGGQLAAAGRIPVQALLAAVDQLEEAEAAS